jgi:type IV pilus assembly protein PilX
MKKQTGSSLIIVVIALTLLLIISVAYIRSSHVTSLVAENFAFKTAATQAADIGVEQALATLQTLTSPDTSIANKYYAIAQPVDSNGLPSTVNWAQVPSSNFQLYRVQYIMERLCSGNLPVANVITQCVLANAPANGSNKIGTPTYKNTGEVYYRATVRVTGPKNTLSFIQAILSK